MATRNPTINPTNDPNFTSATRPISVPNDINPQGVETNRIMPRGVEIGDRSAEFEGRAKGFAAVAEGASQKGFTDLFAGVAGVGDFVGKAGVALVRKNIENEVYDIADNERNLYMQRLREIQAGGNVQSIVSAGGSEGEGTPSDITNLPDQLTVLGSARDGGKISSTDYRARLLAKAKDLRAKYPGFRQEIDAEFQKVTGMNPANAVLTGMIADINRQGHTMNSEVNRTLKLVEQNIGVFDDPVEAIQKVQTGEWGLSAVMGIIAPHKKLEANIAERKAVWDNEKLTDAQAEKTGGRLIDDYATGQVDGMVTKFTSAMGLKTEQDVTNMEGRVKSGVITSQHWQELGQEFARQESVLRDQLWATARSNGMVKRLGTAFVKDHIEAAMERTKHVKDRIYAADIGGIHNAEQTIKAMKNDDTLDAMNDPIIGGPLRMAQLARNIGGDQWTAATGLAQAADGLTGKWGAYGKSMQDAIAVQRDLQTTGIPLTLNRVFDSYEEKMKMATEKEKATLVNSTLNRIFSIADKKTPDNVAFNYAISAFSDQRRNFIDRLNEEAYDSRGRETRGKNYVYQQMTSEDMTKRMKALDATHPGIFQRYVDWSTQTIDKLTNRDARYLDQVRNPAIQVGWDSDNHRFKFNYSISDQERSRLHITRESEDAEAQHVRQIVNRLNSNLSGYRHIAEASGGDVDAFILGSLAKAVGPESLSKVGGIPANIIRDIGLSRLKKKGE